MKCPNKEDDSVNRNRNQLRLWRRIEDALAVDCESLGSLNLGTLSDNISLRMWRFREAAKPLGESDQVLRRGVGSWSKLPYTVSRVESSMEKAVNLGDGRPRLRL